MTWPVFHMALLQLDRFSKDNMVCKPVIPSQHDFADLCSIFVALSSDAYISLWFIIYIYNIYIYIIYIYILLMSNICCPLSLSLLRTIWTTWHLMPTVSLQTCHDWSCICRRPTSFQLCVHQCGGWARHLESKSRAGGSGIQVSWRSRHTSLLVSHW